MLTPRRVYQEVIEILKRQEELQAAPGEEYNYNNSAFIMLAEIVERISGQTFPEFMEENVFGPLGMNSTVVRTDPVTIISGASQGYTRDSTGYKETGDLYSAYGAGGIYSTPADFARWMSNFNDPVVGGRRSDCPVGDGRYDEQWRYHELCPGHRSG
ncbi:MAG: beta-lactamase family protein [Bacteroidales bacterium]|nr:beta-lactamase family protein [Bacteroidales bacterium]